MVATIWRSQHLVCVVRWAQEAILVNATNNEHSSMGASSSASKGVAPRTRRGSVLPWERPEEHAARTSPARERRGSLVTNYMAATAAALRAKAAKGASVLPTAWEKQRAKQQLGQPAPLADPNGVFAAREAAHTVFLV